MELIQGILVGAGVGALVGLVPLLYLLICDWLDY